jgi:hypothetical protein
MICILETMYSHNSNQHSNMETCYVHEDTENTQRSTSSRTRVGMTTGRPDIDTTVQQVNDHGR